jgi:hypothetical protein
MECSVGGLGVAVPRDQNQRLATGQGILKAEKDAFRTMENQSGSVGNVLLTRKQELEKGARTMWREPPSRHGAKLVKDREKVEEEGRQG